MKQQPAFEMIKAKQEKWANDKGVKYTEGYLEDLWDNFFEIPSNETIEQYQNADGDEFNPSKGKAKVSALYSSSALVINFFEFLKKDFKQNLKTIFEHFIKQEIRFEYKVTTGIAKRQANIDLAILSTPIFIESKFTEPYYGHISEFKEAYFTDNHWKKIQLPNIQKLAEDIWNKKITFKRFDAPQILKHILALTKKYGKNYYYFFLWYKIESDESKELESEIELFKEKISDDFRFITITYQELFTVVMSSFPIGSNSKWFYTNIIYLQERYFPEVKLNNIIEQFKIFEDLFGSSFMSIFEYNDKFEKGELKKKGSLEDDITFEKNNPEHPMAANNRFTRIASADNFRNIHKTGMGTKRDNYLDMAHAALFDCCATVRLSIVEALFYINDKKSLPFLKILLTTENESASVKEAVELAVLRYEPMKGIKNILLASNNFMLGLFLFKYCKTHNYGLSISKEESIKEMMEDKPDLIVLDIKYTGEEAFNKFVNLQWEIYENAMDPEFKDYYEPDQTPILFLEETRPHLLERINTLIEIKNEGKIQMINEMSLLVGQESISNILDKMMKSENNQNN